jgi:hypothetical protein
MDSWGGRAGNNQGNDTFIFAMDSNVMLDTTFSNVNGSNQDYPNARGLGNFAPQTGALNVDKNHGGTLDNGYYSNSLYRFTFSSLATSDTMVLSFITQNLQSISDESWGLDNVYVETGAVPEPATLAVLGLGAASIIRRRKKS